MQAWQQAKISMLAHKMCHIAQQSDSHKVPYLQLCNNFQEELGSVYRLWLKFICGSSHFISTKFKPSICYFTFKLLRTKGKDFNQN